MAMPGVLSNVSEAIGKTPMVLLNRVTDGIAPGCKIIAKLEMQNPGGSVKDRIAKSMLEAAEKEGIISPSKTTVIEPTSGNTGIAVAMLCAAKGYKCIICMPQVPPMFERAIICRKFGAEVHFTSAKKGIAGLLVYVKEKLESSPDYWSPSQFSNEENPKIHYDITGPEIWEQTGGHVDWLISGVGTGGTINGCGRYLKEKNPGLKIAAVEPTESRVLTGAAHTKHTVLGIGAGIVVPFVEQLAPGQAPSDAPRGIIDEFLHATSDESIQLATALAEKEGLLVGPSTGAACKAALEIARRPESKDKVIVVIFPSSGIRYVSHPLWADVKTSLAGALPSPPAFDDDPPLLRWTSDGSHLA
mmetsp:Transcript_59458/g.189354  ORF Transcript_59458/g.189354 Transcript_59458/m.189354 type:complete len:359 (-) Transcript_59458:76-1152(-)